MGADADSMNSILSTLADLHQSVGDASAAASCHRRLLANNERGPPGDLVRSYLFLAKYELEGGDGHRGGSNGQQPQQRLAGGGSLSQEANWGLAAQYLQNIVIHVRPPLSLFLFLLSHTNKHIHTHTRTFALWPVSFSEALSFLSKEDGTTPFDPFRLILGPIVIFILFFIFLLLFSQNVPEREEAERLLKMIANQH